MSTLLSNTAKNPAQLKAARLKGTPLVQFTMLLNAWRQGVSTIWDSPNPQGILDELGTSAGELFTLSAATAAFFQSLRLPQRCNRV